MVLVKMKPILVLAMIKKPFITVWTFLDFSVIHILRETNFEGSRSAKSTISTHLKALNFDFYEFLHFC